MKRILNFKILPQPTETTCGPTCLHSVYRFYGEELELSRVIDEVDSLAEGGTLAVILGNHALQRGYRARIYSYNLNMFDPTWFKSPRGDLRLNLEAQRKVKKYKKFQLASEAYIEFLDLGGQIKFQDMTPALLRGFIESGIPILTGLSATYLYQSARELPDTNEYDSISGEPSGHFVVLSGYDRQTRKIRVADPFSHNPFSNKHYYWVDMQRLIAAVLLGVVTYDGNLLIIEPRENKKSK